MLDWLQIGYGAEDDCELLFNFQELRWQLWATTPSLIPFLEKKSRALCKLSTATHWATQPALGGVSFFPFLFSFLLHIKYISFICIKTFDKFIFPKHTFFPLINLFIYYIFPQQLPSPPLTWPLSPPLSLHPWEGRIPFGHQPTLALQVTVGLGISFPPEARQGGPVRVMGPTGR